MAKKMTEEERAENKRHKAVRKINNQLRSARGTVVNVPVGVNEASVKMGGFIRRSTGRTNGKADKRELLRLKRQAMEQGYLINDAGEILHDIRTNAEKEAQDGH